MNRYRHLRPSAAPRSTPWLVIRNHHRYRQPIIALAADRLDHRCGHTRLGGKRGVEAAHALDAGIGAAGVDHRAIAHHIIGDDQAAAPSQLERPFELVNSIVFGLTQK